MRSHTFHEIPTLAWQDPLVGPPSVGFRGGPIILNDEWQALRHTRYGYPADTFNLETAITEKLPGRYLYAGPAYDHFGHVMSEMVHRLLPSAECMENRCLLMIAPLGDEKTTGFDALPRFFQEVLGFFAIDPARIVIINQDLIVEELTIFEQGSDFGGGPKPGYLELLAGFTERLLGKKRRAAEGSEKLYVSRSSLPGGGGFLGESYIEELLSAHGFHILKPEKLPLIEQMVLYRNADLVVFPEGSAVHGVELLGAGDLKRVVFIPRRDDHIDIFARVLGPRASEFIALPLTHAMGTLLNRWSHVTISILDFEGLFATLREREFLGEVAVDVDRFVDTCELDFMRHIRYILGIDPDVLDPELVSSAHRYLAAELSRLKSQYSL